MSSSRSFEHSQHLARIGVSERERSERAAALRRRKKLEYQLEYAGRPAPEKPPRERSQRVYAGWSAQSRRHMLRRFSSLDLTRLITAGMLLVTLTLPGDWCRYAPTGEAWSKLLKRFFDRLDRAWGPVSLLYKSEFQGRGAVHGHLAMEDLPGVARFGRGKTAELLPIREWISRTWPDVVGAEGEDRRLMELASTQVRPWYGQPGSAVAYFAKYISKSGETRHRQDQPPEEWMQPGTGLARVWGYRHLKIAVVEHDLVGDEVQWAQRILRRYMDAQRRTKRVRVQRGSRRRYVTRPVRVLRHAKGGWVVLPEAPRIAAQVDRAARIAAGTEAHDER